MKKISTALYLLQRLKELGITDIFGVPGDYNLIFLDSIVNAQLQRWVGNCNELNAAYAADGYARVRGAAALVTTFGVGELSAINGVAGSFAEFLPVVNIVGAPSTTTQKEKVIMHHTFGTGDFGVFMRMFKEVSAAMVILDSSEENGARIDYALEMCWVKKQPVYISLPSDMVNIEIEPPKRALSLTYPSSDIHVVAELVDRTVALIERAKSPVVLVDLCAARHGMQELIEQFLDNTNIPYALMNMGKGALSESHNGFLGHYNGNYSSPGVQKRVEESDCIISFGTMLSDFNTGGFTCKLNAEVSVEIHSCYVKVQHSLYPNAYFDAVIPALTTALKDFRHHEIVKRPPVPGILDEPQHLTQKFFWSNIAQFFKPHDIVIGETGTSMFALVELPLPEQTLFIGQALWGSIGYTMGAVLGAALAAPKRRTLLFIGDGSFQLTAQELSTLLRHQLKPIIFLLNNQGYTIERVIHGATMPYNDVQPWNYSALPAVFGENVFTQKVRTAQELKDVLKQVEHHQNQLCFIEVMLAPNDCPESLRRIAQSCEIKNEG